MTLIENFKLANDIEGTFVEVGFGRGRTAKSIFDAMNAGTLTKRDSFLFDSFMGSGLPTPVDLQYNSELEEGQDPGRYQVAMDMRYELGNHYSIAVVKAYVSAYMITLYSKETIACLHIDLPSYSATVEALERFSPYLNKDAIIHISGYGDSLGVTRAVDAYIDDNLLTYQFFTHNYGSYIKNKIAPVFYKKPHASREFDVPETFVEVKRPKKVAFADRYIKPLLKRFKPTPTVLTGVSPINTIVSKPNIKTPETSIPVPRNKVKAYDDRYQKQVISKFKPTPTIKDGLDIIDKSVSR